MSSFRDWLKYYPLLFYVVGFFEKSMLVMKFLLEDWLSFMFLTFLGLTFTFRYAWYCFCFLLIMDEVRRGAPSSYD